jgi:hypothetical protein
MRADHLVRFAQEAGFGPPSLCRRRADTLEKFQPVGGVLSAAGPIVELAALSPRVSVILSARHAARCPRADTRSDRSILRAHVVSARGPGLAPTSVGESSALSSSSSSGSLLSRT